MMNASSLSLMILPSERAAGDGRNERKILVTSLQRSLFKGGIAVSRNDSRPLFKMERASMAELAETANLEARRQHLETLGTEAGRWVVFAREGGVALRGIDHLFPTDAGAFPPRRADFLYAVKDSGKGLLSAGLWAVRAPHAVEILTKWEETRMELTDMKLESSCWTEFVAGLSLNKMPFERGEIQAPDMDRMDWKRISNAAFVTVHDWPEEERWRFLQAVYFSTYFGDPTGLVLDILDP